RSQPLAEPALGHAGPVDLRDLPRLAELGAKGRRARQRAAVHRDAMRLDVVGMPVVAVLVVRDHDLWSGLAYHRDDERRRLEQVGSPERVRAYVWRWDRST